MHLYEVTYSLWTPLHLWYFCCKLISMHLWNWQNFLLFAAHTTRHLWLATDVICNCFQLTRVRFLFPWDRTESQILFYLILLWYLLSSIMRLSEDFASYQRYPIMWNWSLLLEIIISCIASGEQKQRQNIYVEPKTWTIQYKIQWHNVLFQRSSFTMTMTTSARGLKQSQCDRSFSKT